MAQAVLLAAFQQLGRLKDPRRLGGWLRSMTIRDCVDWQRRRRREAADLAEQERWKQRNVEGMGAPKQTGDDVLLPGRCRDLLKQ